MKATGIVRRVDDLGRVVIPKEIRRTMRVREGDPLEIYMCEDGGVVFKRYSASLVADVENLRDYIDDYVSDDKQANVRRHFDAIIALLKEDE